MGIQTAPHSAANAYAVPASEAWTVDSARTGSRSRNCSQAHSFYSAFGKRSLDVAGAAIALLILSPLILLLWLLVRLDGGPGYYGDDRVGRDGRRFKCWKLRSMRPDAAGALARHLETHPEAAEEWHRNRKLSHDPRITRVGRLIRKYSLDELPQFWNVLCGEMSLVGPRPVCAEELPRYGTATPVYLAVRPGVTGLWQVSGRNAVSYARRVALDVEYCARVKLLTDLRICLSTVRVMVTGDGR